MPFSNVDLGHGIGHGSLPNQIAAGGQLTTSVTTEEVVML